MSTSSNNVSVMIFTLNEEIHLPACLASVEWSDDVIVVDSFSTDGTEDICRKKGARFFQNGFEGFGAQRNWALQHTRPRHDWVLILDADERVPQELAEEIKQAAASAAQDTGAFCLKRRFYFLGKWLRYSNLYPTWVARLVHKDKVIFRNRGHAETQEVKGRVLKLKNDLIDENLKGIEAWFERQDRYSSKEAEYEIENERTGFKFSDLFSADPLKRRAFLKAAAMKLPARAVFYFIYCYVFRLGFLDGREGFMFCRMKAAYQGMIALKKRDLKIKKLA